MYLGTFGTIGFTFVHEMKERKARAATALCDIDVDFAARRQRP
jgi:hypothetical protein